MRNLRISWIGVERNHTVTSLYCIRFHFVNRFTKIIYFNSQIFPLHRKSGLFPINICSVAESVKLVLQLPKLCFA